MIEAYPLAWHQNATIAVLSCGPKALLSHTSALINLELLSPSSKRGPYQRYKNLVRDQIHVLSNRRSQIRSVKSHHRSLSIDDYSTSTVVNGIPQVNIERAIVDSARSLEDYELDSIVENAFMQGLTTPIMLGKELEKLRTAPGRERRRLLEYLQHYSASELRNSKTESLLERRVLLALKKHISLEVFPQYVVLLHGHQYRIDFAIPSKKIAIEVDSFQFHRTRMQFDNDRIRQNVIINAGWKMVRVTSKFTDEEIVTAVLQSLNS